MRISSLYQVRMRFYHQSECYFENDKLIQWSIIDEMVRKLYSWNTKIIQSLQFNNFESVFYKVSKYLFQRNQRCHLLLFNSINILFGLSKTPLLKILYCSLTLIQYLSFMEIFPNSNQMFYHQAVSAVSGTSSSIWHFLKKTLTWESFPYMPFDRHQIGPNSNTEYDYRLLFHLGNSGHRLKIWRFSQTFHEGVGLFRGIHYL